MGVGWLFMLTFCVLLVFLVGKVSCYGFAGHHVIAIFTWNFMGREAKNELSSRFQIKNIKDFVRLAAFPDLVKHKPTYLEYFSLHFYNNELDNPPNSCAINIDLALKPGTQENIIKAVEKLVKGVRVDPEFSWIHLSFLVHLLMDLHQPLHLTAAMKGGMKIRFPMKNGKTFSLHALWDAEMLKLFLRNRKNISKITELLIAVPKKYQFSDVEGRWKYWVKRTAAENCLLWPGKEELAGNYINRERHRMFKILVLSSIRIAALLNSVLVKE